MERDYSELVASPYDDEPSSGWKWVTAIALFVVVVGGGSGWWLSGGSDIAEDEMAFDSTTTTSVTSVVSDVPLVPWVKEPQILNLPTLAPEGFEVCGSARFVSLCNPNSDTMRITIAFSDGPISDTASTGVDGVRWVGGTDNEVAIVFQDFGIVYTGEGMNGSLLRDIVASVPLAMNDWIVFADEEPLSEPPLERAFLAALFDIPEDQVEHRGSGYWAVDRPDIQFMYGNVDSYQGGEAGIKIALNQSALTLRDPTTIRDNRPLLVGLRTGTSRWSAEWIQRGYFWSLTMPTSAVADRTAFEELVTRIEEEIANLP